VRESLPMPVWTIAAVADEPQTTLTNWQVVELPNGDRHLVGYAIEAREGRVSSRIHTFDQTTLRAVTRSGRTYQLRGRPGVDTDAACVWRTWMRLNHATDFADVSSQVWPRGSEPPTGGTAP